MWANKMSGGLGVKFNAGQTVLKRAITTSELGYDKSLCMLNNIVDGGFRIPLKYFKLCKKGGKSGHFCHFVAFEHKYVYTQSQDTFSLDVCVYTNNTHIGQMFGIVQAGSKTNKYCFATIFVAEIMRFVINSMRLISTNFAQITT